MANADIANNPFRVGDWYVKPSTHEIIGPEGTVILEPQVMTLLVLLASRVSELVTKSDIIKAVWGEVIVNEDALTRCVFKLRKALGDDARTPTYITTVSKRGYRLIAPVTRDTEPLQHTTSAHKKTKIFVGIAICLIACLCILGAWSVISLSTSPKLSTNVQTQLLARADGFYSQYTRADNEAAYKLYEDILSSDPQNAAALAGLSNTLMQRAIRYNHATPETATLSLALEKGWLDSETGQNTIARAITLAREATDLDPSHDRAWRALGLALSAARQFPDAQRAYERALIIDPEDWGTMINLSELYQLTEQDEASTPYLEQAWFAMDRRYAQEAVSIRPWHSAVGISVATKKAQTGELEDSVLWFKRVLTRDPLNVDAVRGLSHTLMKLGDTGTAAAICAELERARGESCTEQD